MHFVLLAKDDWLDAPRIRHQLAELLARRGHEVLFFQKPHPPFTAARADPVTPAGIELTRTRELLHHQLRLTSLLERANAHYVRHELRRVLGTRLSRKPSVLINFRYDYFFLRDVIGDMPLVSLFNDDFVGGARWFAKATAARALARTAAISDHCLAVSTSIVEQLRPHARRVDLFLPWARRAYHAPAPTAAARDLLYWGYINERIDFDVVEALLNRGVRIHFVGPVSGPDRVMTTLRHPNAVYHGVKTVEQLAPIAAKCAASILPYDTRNEMVQAVTMSNRGFDLLSFGLPLLYVDLPGLLDAPRGVIYRCRTVDDFQASYESARQDLHPAQERIESFLKQHTADARYSQLLGHLRGMGISSPSVASQATP